MFELLDQLNDEESDFTVRFTDTKGVKREYEFLDIVLYEGEEYVVVLPLDSDDGYVDIFRIFDLDDKECYEKIEDETGESVFEIFRLKNEDEFDFE